MQKLIILRGCPGCGKSTLAQQFIKDYQLSCWNNEQSEYINLSKYSYVILSADDYFKCGNQYLWRPHYLHAAHKRCEELCNIAMYEKIPLIIIDNTNTVYSQYKRYIKMAELYLYDIEIHSLYTSGFTAKTLAERNTHNVSEEKIQEMIDKYQTRSFYSTKEAEDYFGQKE